MRRPRPSQNCLIVPFAVLLLCVFVNGGCASGSPEEPIYSSTVSDCPDPEWKQSCFYERGHGRQLIIFVHGVMGGNATTWGSPSAEKFWPRMVLTDPKFAGRFDVYLINYITRLRGEAPVLYEIAGDELSRLRDLGVFRDYDAIHIIAHSMGGLVTKSMLIRLQASGDILTLQKIRSVIFLGTPSMGASVAERVSLLSSNPQFREMTPSRSNSFLQLQEDMWGDLLNQRDSSGRSTPRVYCAYETRPTMGILIVPREMAQSRCDGGLQPMTLNHIGLVTVTRRDLPPYLWTMARVLAAEQAPQAVQASGRTSGTVMVTVEQRSMKTGADLAFLQTKIERNLVQLLSEARHKVVGGLVRSAAADGGEPTHILRVWMSEEPEGAIGLMAQLEETRVGVVASTEFEGQRKDLEENYKILPELVFYGLDVDPGTLKKMRSVKRPTRSIGAFRLYLQGRRELGLGKIDAGIKLLKAATDEDPSFAMAYWTIGRVLEDSGKQEEGGEWIRRARSIDLDHPRWPYVEVSKIGDPLPTLFAASQRVPFTSVREGFSTKQIRVPEYSLNLAAWKIDPRFFKIRVWEQREATGQTVEEFLALSQGLFAINGGFFEMDTKGRLSPSGLLIVDGARRQATTSAGGSGALVGRDGRFDVIPASDVASGAQYDVAVQSGPRLVERTGKMGIYSNNFDRQRRSAVCVRGSEIVFAIIWGEETEGLSLYELATLLVRDESEGGFGCDVALNLDGGPSAQATSRVDVGGFRLQGLWKVQNALVVVEASLGNAEHGR